MTRPCLRCGRLTQRPQRCATCQKMHDAERNHRRTQYHGGWQTTSRQARQAEPWCHCSGCTNCQCKDGIEGCLNMDLTLDHEHRRVECKPCNSGHRRNADK